MMGESAMRVLSEIRGNARAQPRASVRVKGCLVVVKLDLPRYQKRASVRLKVNLEAYSGQQERPYY